MLTVRTYLSNSDIHGVGVFTKERIKKDTIVWEHNPVIDLMFNHVEIDEYFTENQREWLKNKCYYEKEFYRLDGDDARYMNHSLTPNLTTNARGQLIANKDIEIDDELTCNYSEFAEEWPHDS